MGEHRRVRKHTSSYLAKLSAQVRQGVLIGLTLAALYCAYAVVLFVLRGAAPFDAHDVTLRMVLATYVACGIAGGVVYGLLHPLADSLLGRTVLGVLIATLVFFGITVATHGLPRSGAARRGRIHSSWARYSGSQSACFGVVSRVVERTVRRSAAATSARSKEVVAGSADRVAIASRLASRILG
jgi:hypothetical protein